MIENRSIIDSAVEMVENLDQPPVELAMLDVVWYEDRWYVAGSYNRRLALYRLLEFYFPESVGKRIYVRRMDPDRVKWYDRNNLPKLSTNCEGEWVEIRGISSPLRIGSVVGKKF